MNAMVAVATGFSAVNILILVGLLSIYARMAMKTRAGYTFGLMTFSGLLLSQNSVMTYICGFMSNSYGWQLYPFLDALAVLEFVGLVVLLKVTV